MRDRSMKKSTKKSTKKNEERGPQKAAGNLPVKFTLFLIPLAAAMCFFGIYRGEAAVILSKAITICLECIGLG